MLDKDILPFVNLFGYCEVRNSNDSDDDFFDDISVVASKYNNFTVSKVINKSEALIAIKSLLLGGSSAA